MNMESKRRAITKLPVIRGVIRKVDKTVKEEGLVGAMKRLAVRSHSKIVVAGYDTQLEIVLQTKPVVIVANHPYEGEPAALISTLPERRDISLIINSDFMNISIELDEYFIPVFVGHHRHAQGRDFLGVFFNILMPQKRDSDEEARAKNRESIATASQKLKNGGLVIIFPGKRGVNGKWFSGVGHLLKSVGSEVYVVKAYIEGTSNKDRLRVFGKSGRFLPQLTVYYAKPNKFESGAKEGKEIAQMLEAEYNEWVKTLQ